MTKNKNLNFLELLIASVGTGALFPVILFILSKESYQSNALYAFSGFLALTTWAYVVYRRHFTKTGRKSIQNYLQQQAQLATRIKSQPKPQLTPTKSKPVDQSLSLPRLQSELKIIQEQIKLARMDGDHQLELDLKEQEQHLRTQIQRLQAFVITRGFRH